GQTETRQMSYSAGAFFDILDRYTIDVAARRDGSSRFGSEHRWQTYYRVSGAWLMAREEWFPIEQVTGFTLRASLGTAGNVPNYSAQYERSEEHTSELQSRENLVCRLLLEKKNLLPSLKVVSSLPSPARDPTPLD